MNTWDYGIWESLIQLGILVAGLLIANTLCRKLPFMKKSLIPSSVIGGIIILLLKFIPAFENIINNGFMEATAYHCLALGFISLTLRNTIKNKEGKMIYVKTAATTVGTYLIQAISGLVITILFSLVLTDIIPAAGILLALGYGQGPGQALNFGNVYAQAGLAGGASFGLTIATTGFLVACIGGVIYLNILRRKGIISKEAISHSKKVEEDDGPNDIPLSESVDRLTIQVALVLLVYFVTWGLMQAVTLLIDSGALGNFGFNTLKPLIWGFNFLFAILIAVLFKSIIALLKKKGIMTRNYPNTFLLNRMGGLFFDIMILAGAAAIDFASIKTLILPLIVLCAVGVVVTFVYLNFICKRLYPTYRLPAFMSMYGMLTGTASTGVILLREVDPNFETPAANNLIFQNIPAIIMGFPILLLAGFAPQGMTESIITLGVCIVLFFVMNFIILFKRKKK
ncbi:MAG: sodium:glutamate symporter [Clostridia bacterium]|nr:sodium:glutamate symporter [Clostridia bacterium]